MLATRKIFKSAFGKITLPQSLPSITYLPFVASLLAKSLTKSRTNPSFATFDASIPHSSVRMNVSTSSPLYLMTILSFFSTVRSKLSSCSFVGFKPSTYPTVLYNAPVSICKNPSRFDNNFASVLLPLAAGPSIVTINLSFID